VILVLAGALSSAILSWAIPFVVTLLAFWFVWRVVWR
jgi:hypothetical protein